MSAGLIAILLAIMLAQAAAVIGLPAAASMPPGSNAPQRFARHLQNAQASVSGANLLPSLSQEEAQSRDTLFRLIGELVEIGIVALTIPLVALPLTRLPARRQI